MKDGKIYKNAAKFAVAYIRPDLSSTVQDLDKLRHGVQFNRKKILQYIASYLGNIIVASLLFANPGKKRRVQFRKR